MMGMFSRTAFSCQLGRLVSAIFLILALARPATAEPVRYTLDPAHLTVAFLVDHIGYAKTLGIFREVSGGFTYDEAAKTVTDIVVTVRTASVDTFHAQRDAHVRNEDFLDVETHPEMVFEGVEAIAEGPDRGRIIGNLTLLGQTRPIELVVVRNKSAPYPFGRNPPNTLGLSLRGSFDRSDFGMTYGVDNGLVGDRIELLIEVEANAAP